MQQRAALEKKSDIKKTTGEQSEQVEKSAEKSKFERESKEALFKLLQKQESVKRESTRIDSKKKRENQTDSNKTEAMEELVKLLQKEKKEDDEKEATGTSKRAQGANDAAFEFLKMKILEKEEREKNSV